MATRRSILRGAAAAPLALALGATAAPTAATAAPEPAGVPQTLAYRRRGLTSGDRVTPDQFPLTHLAVSFTGHAAAVRLRTRDGRWTGWRPVHTCGVAHGVGQHRTGIVPASGVVAYEVQVKGGSAAVLELNTVDGPTRTVADAPTPLPVDNRYLTVRPPISLPTYVSRAGWGADESYRYNPDGTLDTPPEFFPVQTLTVHHTGFDDTQPDPAATIRAIYYTQAVENDWGDVGYQLFIDDQGRVYEGTYSDPDPVPVYGPERLPDGRPQMVNGAHVGGFNAGNVGVCLIGDFTSRLPTAAARSSLVTVLAVLASDCRLWPAGVTEYVNPVNGYEATVTTVLGHRDWNTANPLAGPTQCPGNTFYPMLSSIRQDVARLTRRLMLGR